MNDKYIPNIIWLIYDILALLYSGLKHELRMCLFFSVFAVLVIVIIFIEILQNENKK